MTEEKASERISFRVTDSEREALQKLTVHGARSAHDKARALVRIALQVLTSAKESGVHL